MNNYKQGFLLFLLIALWGVSHAQPLEVNNSAPFTPQNLITNVFLGEGVQVLSVTYEGVNKSVGFFKDGEPHIGIDRGIVMTTGTAVTAGGENGVDAVGTTQAAVPSSGMTVTDPDLLAISGGVNIWDVAKYTITFIPISDTLRFRYAFGSEEYPEYACSDFNDIFGFFISGPGINGPYENNGKNIALIPGTNLPVRINNVNNGMVGGNGSLANCTPPAGTLAFSGFYNGNQVAQQPVYDGFTDVFTAEAVVIPCNVYTIKLVICDVSDGSHDSGVFLEAKSFGTGSLDVKATTVSVDGSVAEGCSEGTLTFSLPTAPESDFPLDYNILGTATNGVDYELIPPGLFIPAGSTSISIPIIGIEDGILEGTETIILDIKKDVCNRDTIIIPLRDNPLVPANLGPDQRICLDNSIQLDGTLPVPLPDPPTFTNNTETPINQTNISYFSDITVFGVIPPILGSGVIRSICIDSISHRWIDDLDIYLVGPNGQFIELSTDNGGNGGNGGGLDYYINACFTEAATTPINAPGPFAPPSAVPFTGDWLPEGVWSDLWDGNNKNTNGTWRLQVIDDSNGFPGTLHSWTITFNPAYEITYDWSPQAGLSCADCPNPEVMPTETTTYVMTAVDSYGCSVSDSINIEIIPKLDAPQLECGTNTESSVSVFWPAVDDAVSYEVSIDNGPWIASSDPLAHVVTGLSLSQSVSIRVRAIGECPGDEVELICTTPDCTPPVAFVDQTSDATCNGSSDGTATITASGGAGMPFVYELEGVSNSTGVFSGLAAGTYVATATDANNCAGLVQVTIGEPEALDVQMILNSAITCNGLSNGVAEAIVNGGTQPFTFSWDNGDQGAIAANLAAGQHSVEITDGNGCQTTRSITLTEPELLTVQTTTRTVRCNGGSDGRAIATVDGGTIPYSYQWDAAAANQQADTAFALSASIYNVTITDANGCTSEASAEVMENTPISLFPQSQNASCDDTPDGTATVSASGGVEPYSYRWTETSSGSLAGNSASVLQLSPGTYIIAVTDAAMCTYSAEVNIGAPAPIDVVLNTQIPLCTGASDGTATLTVSGGTPSFEYAWSDNGAATINRTDLQSGSYTVTVSDANNCSTEISFDLGEPTPVEVALSTTPTNCFGSNDGTATVVAMGGAGNYTYAWQNNQNGATANGLSAGNISVVVSDANGCQATGSIEVTQPEALQITLSPNDLSCFNNNSGAASAIVSGGTGTYTYQWSNGGQSAATSGLAAGNVGLTVTDSNGCQASSSTTISQPTALSATIASTLVSCLGQPDGTATVMPSGGTAPYTYAWSDPSGQQTAVANSLNTGSYTVTVSDANGCTFQTSITVGGTPPISLTLTDSDVRCFDGSDGSISITATGGNGNFGYSWSNPSIPQTANPSGLRAGQYALTVTDSGGCTATISTTISQPELLQVQTSGNSLICANDNSGTTQAAVSGGIAPYNYLWSTGVAADALSGVMAGTYRLSVTDANGCLATSEVSISAPPVLTASFDAAVVDCFGAATGAVTSSINGGVQPYTYLWSNGAATRDLTDVPAGSYDLAITDANGCQLEKTVEVLQPDAPLAATFETQATSCFGDRDGSILASATGGTPFYTYSLDGDKFFGSAMLIGLEAGTYNVFIRDSKGCLFFSEEVAVEEPEAIAVDLGTDVTLNYGEEIRLEPQINGGLGALIYSWLPADTSILSCIDCPSPIANVLYQTSFTLRVTDENGCSDEDIITIFAKKSNPVFVPTGFTPNSDGSNDRLLVHGKEGIVVRHFAIYDRWGELLYEARDFEVNDPNIGWDGAFKGKPMNGGVFIWRLEVEFEDGNLEVFNGGTTLIR